LLFAISEMDWRSLGLLKLESTDSGYESCRRANQ
jgi:hypothetical protein